jgi:hypothetical protein
VIDTLLLIYIAIFLDAKAVLVRRETRLGWALACANFTVSLLFWYAIAMRPWPWLRDIDALSISLRLVTAVAVTWAVVELFRARVHGWPRT